MEQGLARQLGCSWKTLWMAVRPVLEVAAADESRFVGVTCLGVDEHVWHHVPNRPVDQGGRGPKEFTGMVDLTRHQDGHLRARLLDQVRPALARPTRRGFVTAATRSARGFRSPLWNRSMATRTPSTTSSRMLSRSLGANNGGTEAISGQIELARRVARCFRDPGYYRLRMLLIGGGLPL
jgi:hypothetical protein